MPENGKPVGTIEHFDEAIRLRPNFPEAFIGRGAARGALSQHKDPISFPLSDLWPS